jgi:hypothetical protein
MKPVPQKKKFKKYCPGDVKMNKHGPYPYGFYYLIGFPDTYKNNFSTARTYYCRSINLGIAEGRSILIRIKERHHQGDSI